MTQIEAPLKTSRKRQPAWHAEARALFADGVSIDALADRFNKARTSIHYALSHDRYLAKARARLEGRPTSAIIISSSPYFVAKHQPRKIRRAVAEPATVMEAARAFAAGAIDRAELMRRIAQ